MRIAIAGGTGTVGVHTVAVARERGHEVVVLSRSEGVDLVTGAGLTERLEGVDVVIDVTSVQTQSAAVAQEFFGAVTNNLLDAEMAAGVGHHIALSIVGSDRAPHGYYAGKVEQERLVAGGRVPWTILRATQFHEFAQQMYGRISLGPIVLVPLMRSQPVAAREVGERLVAIAEGAPAGLATDLAGPDEVRLADMVRRYAATAGKRGPIVELPLPGGFGRAMRDGTLLADPSADLGSLRFEEWLSGVTAG